MRKVLQNRILELGRGEEGVALVVTLAVFMFMYLFCAGVFAVGKMVKDRICLQNAADAAAYSAAVVQADTLSRIATINRAMSWTYAQMNKRRMDYIVYRWMEHAKQHYADDRQRAANWVGLSLRNSPHYRNRNTCYHGTMCMGQMTVGCKTENPIGGVMTASDSTAVRYANRQTGVETAIENALSRYGNYLDYNRAIVESCYDTCNRRGIDGLEYQIDADMKAIALMNENIQMLRKKMKGRMETAAREILRANVSDFSQCAYVIKVDPGVNYLKVMENTAANEYRFHEWGNKNIAVRRYLHWSEMARDANGVSTLNGFYGSGAGDWFKSEWNYLNEQNRPERGFRWQYTGELTASWTWWAWRCTGCSYSRVHNRLTGLWEWRWQHENKTWANCTHVASEPCALRTPPDCQSSSRLTSALQLGQHCSTRGSVLRGYRLKKGNRIVRRNDSWILDCRYLSEKRRGQDPSANNRGDLLWAKPVTLTSDYFEKEGTITVGIARPNYNPWRDQYVMGRKDRQSENIGIYHAFDPFLDWMVCFASARAGYKAVIDDVDRELENRYCRARVENGPRDYCIDYKDLRPVARKVTDAYSEKYGWYKKVELVLPTWRQRWNLCQSDWDAVMLPVCRAGSGAFENLDTDFTYGYLREPCWRQINGHYLENLVVNETWTPPEEGTPFAANWYAFQAGSGQPREIQGYGSLRHPQGDLSELTAQLPERYHGWDENTVQRGGTRAIKWPFAWRVSGPGRRLNWVELQEQMLH